MADAYRYSTRLGETISKCNHRGLIAGFWNFLAPHHKRGDLTGPEFSVVTPESLHVQQNQQNETRQ